MGGISKIFLTLKGEPLILHTLRPFLKNPSIQQIIVPVQREDLQRARTLLKELPVEVMEGGKVRQETVRLALEKLDPSLEIVAIHDGARPLLSPNLLQNCLEAGMEFGAAIPAIPVYDTLKRGKEYAVETIPREELFTIQTPQVFWVELIKEAHRKAEAEGFLATDDASLVERLGVKVRMIKGEKENIKITDPEDLAMAEKLISGKGEFRSGLGIDFHQLVEGRKLFLGGIEISHNRGLLGHSDGDVLLHAIADAILGAAGLEDIGNYFPPDDPKWKDASSLLILSKVVKMAGNLGWSIENIDCTVLAEEPRLAPFREKMRERVAECLGVEKGRVNIKATTTEGMGFVGRKEGICAICSVLLKT